MNRSRQGLVAVVCLLSSLSAFAQAGPGGYHMGTAIPLGGEGGWDYLAVDAGAHRLYVSHATRVEVVDLETAKAVGAIPDTQGVHGIAVAPELGRGFTSNGRANTVSVFDLKTLAVTATVPVGGENPDAIAFEPVSRRVFTFNGRSHDTTAIDAKTLEVVGRIPLGGKPEFAVPDLKGRIWVNIEDTSEIALIDAAGLKVVGRWPLAPCGEPSGLAMDREGKRLFSVCDNKLMAVVDADSGKVVTTLPIGSGVDGVAFDPGTRLAFSSNGEGTVTVVREDSPDKLAVVGTVTTKRGARTIALDPGTHRLYLSTAELGPPPSPTADHPHPRPGIVPGTFQVVVLER
jgi:YVTN family beta-propeller protein